MRRFWLTSCVFSFLFAINLQADDLTVDPPQVWDSPCALPPPLPPPPPIVCVPGDVIVDLNNPFYSEGVLSTEEGGVLTGPNIRIQARKIIYTRRMDLEPPIFTVYCEGDILIDYRGQTLVGDSIFFDFVSNSGTLTCGRIAYPPWYISGEKVDLCPNGNIIIWEGSITTTEGPDKNIELLGEAIRITPDRTLAARNITLRLEHIPVLWFPSFQIDLSQMIEIPFAVTFGWGGYPGTHLGIRYQFFKWNDLKAYARADAFFGQGVGGGIETAYAPADSWAECFTRSYYAHDLKILDPKRKDRYRFQGTYFNRFFEDTTTVNLVYDVVSDGEMATIYNTKDFELETADKTELEIRTQSDAWIVRLFARARVNAFQSVNQRLPEVTWSWHPFEVPHTGIVAQGIFKAGYLDYISSNEIPKGPNLRAGRFEVHPYLYRPFYLGPVTATPEAGLIGIGYTNGPLRKELEPLKKEFERGPSSGEAVGQLVGNVGFRVETAFSRYFDSFKQVAEPYAHYYLLTTPRSSINHHYIFTLKDSYGFLQLIRFGMRQSFFYRNSGLFIRPFWVDIWANAFLDVHKIHQAIPRGYLDAEWQPTARLLMTFNSGWNFQERQIDFYNLRGDYTISQDLALSLEYRHRGRFYWRKADFYNFVLEAVRSQKALLESPVSDKRDTFLARFFYRFNPDWTGKFELRHGWRHHHKQRAYTEYEFELATLLYQHWQLSFKFEAREADKRSSVNFKLVPPFP